MARRSPVAAEGYPASANGATAAPAAEPPERQADGVGAADASGAQAADFTGEWLLVNTIASSSRTGGTTGPDDPSYRSPGLWVPGCMTAPIAAVFTPVVPSVS